MLRPPFRFIPPLGPPRKTPRQRALASLRGIDLTPLEKIKERPATPLKTILPGVLGRLRMEKRQGEAEIVRVWKHVVDPAICEHAQPVGLANGTLIVNVDNSAWLSEIVRYGRKDILNRLQHSFGRETIQRISFRIG